MLPKGLGIKSLLKLTIIIIFHLQLSAVLRIYHNFHYCFSKAKELKYIYRDRYIYRDMCMYKCILQTPSKYMRQLLTFVSAVTLEGGGSVEMYVSWYKTCIGTSWFSFWSHFKKQWIKYQLPMHLSRESCYMLHSQISSGLFNN